MSHHRRYSAAVLLGMTTLFAACQTTPPLEVDTGVEAPPALNLNLLTDDGADRIDLATSPMAGAAGQLVICLEVRTASGWWKGIGINSVEPNVQGEASDGIQCTAASPGQLSLTFWKAKGFGVHTQVGTRTVDLSRYASHRVRIVWRQD